MQAACSSADTTDDWWEWCECLLCGIALSSALEGAATALAGLLAGLAASVLLGWLLIHVINKQTFGWTLLLAVPMPALVLLAALVLIGALGAATVVGFWGADLPADREE